MSIELFDTHCHIDDERFDPDRQDVIARMRENNVLNAVVVGSDMASSRCAIQFADANEGFYAAVGIHPHEAKTYVEGDLDALKEMLKAKQVVALGEIGLDYYYDHSERSVQREVCLKQMLLAHELNVPVIFHVRDAHQDMLEMMKQNREKLTDGIIHCFSGSAEIAKEYVSLGYHISFAGPVTFKNAPKQWEAALAVPIDRLLIETDSPYLSPEPKRGRRNEPGYVAYVMQKLAQLYDMPPEEMARITTQNAKRVYRIS